MPQRIGAKAKLRAYFLEHIGEVLDSDTLRQVAGTSEWARRVRELRDEEGLNILSHNDRSDLKPGQYLLIEPIKRTGFARTISKEIRAFVLDRDGYTCQMCGAGAGEPHPYNHRPTKLQVGHIIDKSLGGSDDPGNLRAICSVCNQGAANITPTRPEADKLLAQIRRTPRSEQLKILEWLLNKFPEEAKQQIEKRR